MSTLLVLAIGALLVGVLLGLLGGGGSILTLPLLVFVGQLGPREAIATSLFVVGVTSAAGLVQHARARTVDVRVGTRFALISMATAFLGGRISSAVPTDVLLIGFALVMLGAAIAMLRPRSVGEAAKGPISWLRVGLAASAVGALSGLVGAGGGFLIVPALTAAARLPTRTAIGTSLMVIALQSAAGLLGQPDLADLDATVVAVASGGAVLGAVLGGRAGRRLKPETLRRTFGWFVLATSLVMLGRQLAAPLAVTLAAPLGRIQEWLSPEFDPAPAALGGALIGIAASAYLLTHGRVSGISGMVGDIIERRGGDRRLSVAFLGGLGASGLVAAAFAPDMVASSAAPLPMVVVAGLLVGYGTRLGSGCTSGHGVCGVSRLARRSIAATLTFIAVGIVTVTLARWIGGGS